jgi:hypothetical protein
MKNRLPDRTLILPKQGRMSGKKNPALKEGGTESRAQGGMCIPPGKERDQSTDFLRKVGMSYWSSFSSE